ncbi:MAG: MotA/TolQ/ExbB proton channel family protein [Rhodospirillales bacterium]|nr:MotA/TolQ/ExbB proton channel family protein [Rhodospirillales bacterium]
MAPESPSPAASAPPPVRPIKLSRTRIDPATIIGIIAGFTLLAAAILAGGPARSFLDVPSILIVVGGTSAVVLTCFSASEVLNTFRVLAKTLVTALPPPGEAARQVVQLADIARRYGPLHLEKPLQGTRHMPFLYKGFTMAVDGIGGDEIEAVLGQDLQATAQRHQRSADVLRRAAEYAPAMGLIGTLIGLVQMLGNLQDPTSIGPAMALALLTTFYGAVLANLVFSPLAAKLERNSAEEALVNHVYLLGAVSVSRQENPRHLEAMLNSVLPPAERIRFFG